MIESVATLQEKFGTLKNPNEEHHRHLSGMEKVAIFITNIAGSMGFFFVLLFLTVGWVSWNLVAPDEMTFDPFPAFVLLLLLTNLIQLHLMPLIMVGQNLQGRHSELRAEHEYRTSRKAELEIETVLLHLEQQQKLLKEVLERLEKLEGRHKP